MSAGALVFVGFMGAGKSTAARIAAHRSGGVAIDTDALLEEQLQTSIASLFDARGEAAFRDAEEPLVLAALARAGAHDAVALGGGALGSERVRAAIGEHTVVWLDVDVETAWSRTTSIGDRPLARDREAFAALHEARETIYETAADALIPAPGGGPSDALLAALDRLRSGGWPASTRLLWSSAASGSHPVWLAQGLLSAGSEPRAADGRRFLVSDETVAALHRECVGPVAAELLIPPGEQHKTLAQAERVWRWLAEAGATRADTVVALGGGVVGDLAGFCAATYQRGVAVLQVPTTLVAQVDSAFGGKTGVDLPEAKNYVGAYHLPAAVLVDPALLETLPASERAAGYAEVVKTALIAGGPLWQQVRAGASVDELTIQRCIRAKLAVVAADERDAGRRQILNLGHTVGHAIETVTGYARYRHGEAVALGLLAALRLSGAEALRAEVAGLFAAQGLPTTLQGADPDAVIAATMRDKKRTGDRVPFVLLSEPGRPEPGHALDDAAVRAAVVELVR